jgi:hypothetical protein
LIKHLKQKGKKIIACATTGIAADILIEGRTLHNRFKLPLFIDKDTKINIKPHSINGK